MQCKTGPRGKETHKVIALVVHLEVRSRPHYRESKTKQTMVDSLR